MPPRQGQQVETIRATSVPQDDDVCEPDCNELVNEIFIDNGNLQIPRRIVYCKCGMFGDGIPFSIRVGENLNRHPALL